MVADREGDCIDCNNKFPNAKRKNGTKKKRCEPCQKKFQEDYTDICPTCNKTYLSVLDNGTVFTKCFDCYTKSFHKCENCDNSIKQEFVICGECFAKEKQKEWDERRLKNESLYPVNNCKTKTCTNQTTYTYCKSCYDENKLVENFYSISSCQKPGCSVKSRGLYKFCTEHSTC